MSIEIKIPDVGESIQEVQIGQWLKQEGDSVEQDENVVELETDKASMELPAPASGKLSKIVKRRGEMVTVGDTVAYIEESDDAVRSETAASDKSQDGDEPDGDEYDGDEPELGEREDDEGKDDVKTRQHRPAERAARQQPSTRKADQREDFERAERSDEKTESDRRRVGDTIPVTPSARRALRKYGLSADQIQPQGERIRREDVRRHVAEQEEAANEPQRGNRGEERPEEPSRRPSKDDELTSQSDLEDLVPMSLIRRRIAEHLVAAQQQAALLTTFNQIDMSRVLDLRRRYQAQFQQRYGIKLGFMSIFVKAVIDALKQCPTLNAEIQGDNILYRNYYHVGIAIGSKKGLVVPVLRHAERMSFAEIETAIHDFAQRAGENKIGPQELQGGTFTISNGGIYGSLLSTPIVNPPQSGVLGMHAIEERPVARGGQVVIRPMMYVALTYDHRIVDGAEAVTFLKRIKEAVEDLARMLVEV